VVFVAALLFYRIGRIVVLRGYPVTDDEFSARFGGQVLSLGRWMLGVPTDFDAYPQLYLFLRRGMITSFDWLGPQLAWAFGELTHTGPTIFTVAAAGLLPFVFLGVSQRSHPGWGAVAVALLLVSPMTLMLSMTTHAHLLSRTGLAVALWAFLHGEASDRPGWWAVFGLAAGMSGLSRPFETATLLVPLLGWAALPSPAETKSAWCGRLGWIAAGLAIPSVMFFLHNIALTGNPFLPARLCANELKNASFSGAPAFAIFNDPGLLWHRFGSNTMYNLLMVSIWFLGPVGILLIALGIARDRFTRLLGFGLILHFALGLLHDDDGIHFVGPIHYADAVVPLIYLSLSGLQRGAVWLRSAAVGPVAALGSLMVGAIVSLGLFDCVHARALREQSLIHATIYGILDAPEYRHSVVLAPRYANVWLNVPRFRSTRSFVFEWRRTLPQFNDDVMILHDRKQTVSRLRQQFPDRQLLRIRLLEGAPFIAVESLKQGEQTFYADSVDK
jgi:hypothetical protein